MMRLHRGPYDPTVTEALIVNNVFIKNTLLLRQSPKFEEQITMNFCQPTIKILLQVKTFVICFNYVLSSSKRGSFRKTNFEK